MSSEDLTQMFEQNLVNICKDTGNAQNFTERAEK